MESLKQILSNKNYFAPAWVFASINIIMGTWVLYLPHIKIKFLLNDEQIGEALFFLALGLLISIPLIPIINKKIGVGRSTILGIICFAFSFNLPLIVSSYFFLCASLFIVGLFSGFTDVSVNAVIAALEKKDSKNLMSSAHGFFSLGGFLGAGIGSFLLGILLSPKLHMLLITLFILMTNIFFSKYYIGIKSKKQPELENKNQFHFIPKLIGLSLVAFIIMCNEGAVEHWSNIFFYDIVEVSEIISGFGFIAFSFFMTLGRFLGDGFSKKIGGDKLILTGIGIAIVGFILVISTLFYLSVLGFGIIGLGLSVIIPELFRMASKTKGVPPSVGISVVTGVGYVGFLLGPIIIGYISNCSNLLTSFIFLTFTLGIAFIIVLLSLKKQTALI